MNASPEAEMRNRFALALFLLGVLPAVWAQNPRPHPWNETGLVARVGDTGFVKITADSFESLDSKQQALAYWLVQASIAIDPIIYDQLSRYGLREKRLLEEIVAHPVGIDAQT